MDSSHTFSRGSCLLEFGFELRLVYCFFVFREGGGGGGGVHFDYFALVLRLTIVNRSVLLPRSVFLYFL